MTGGPLAERVRIRSVDVLSDHWGLVKKTTFDYRRSDGSWQTQTRETYDRGDGATILLYNPGRRTVVLTRQFRFPAFATGHPDLLIETPAGKLEGAHPEDRIKAETEEESGFRISQPVKVFEAYMSPGSLTEKLHFYIATYDETDRVSDGGGLRDEGEDIETLEVTIDEAMAMVADGRIIDGKTIMLLQHAKLAVFV
jgi:nudix-type nucleoside diphosphatase (YffH/AdpP family)